MSLLVNFEQKCYVVCFGILNGLHSIVVTFYSNSSMSNKEVVLTDLVNDLWVVESFD
jgi:hypothetical protein